MLNKDVLEYLLRAEHLVGEIERVIRPQGYAFIHVPNHFPLLGHIRLLFRNSHNPFDYFPDAKRWDFPSIRFFTMQDLCALFAKHDFEVVRDMSFYFFCAGRLNRLVPRLLKKKLMYEQTGCMDRRVYDSFS